MFSEYAPLSWVAAGFVGLLLYAIAVFLYGTGQQRSVRSRYDSKFMQEAGGVDPLAKVFEGKRIFLNDFLLPSNPVCDSKTFVDCEIVGPTNIFLEGNNTINEVRPVFVDGVALEVGKQFYNGSTFRNCAFRGCTFHKVTLFFTAYEATKNQHLEWVNWITPLPLQEQLPMDMPSQIEDQSDQSHKEPEEKKLR